MAHVSPPPHVNYTHLDLSTSLPHDKSFVTIDDSVMESNHHISAPSFQSQRNPSVDLGIAHQSTTAPWPDYHFRSDATSLQQPHMSPFPDHASFPPYKSSNGSQSTLFSNQHGLWSLNEASGACTPTRSYVGLECESTGSLASFANHLAQPTMGFHAADASATEQAARESPRLCKEWASLSSADQTGGDWSVLSESHPSSPSYLGSIDVLRRDGIRKKNARFEIPAERNLQTIDKLISTTTDEHQIKELKQQKRLLRNRQAALDSRQRKKQHTERLEEEKKSFTTYINELEEEIMALRLRNQEWAQEKERWIMSQQNCQQYIESLTIEKDEMIRKYTIETGDLRKKNLHLADQIRQLENATMSSAPSSTGFSTDYSDFDHVAVQSNPWEHFSSVNDFSIESEQSTAPIASASPQLAKHIHKADDASTTSSLCLLLLLCGAWVASRNSQTGSMLPRMPDDVRMASATVLDHLYQDAGLDSQRLDDLSGNDISGSEASHVGQVSKIELSSPIQPHESPLDALHRHLTATSEDQIREQAFSLTPSQYHGISTDTACEPSKAVFAGNKRSLQDSLVALRRRSQTNSMDSYSRSILWDRLPKDIVKDFARIVAENAKNQPRKMEPVP